MKFLSSKTLSLTVLAVVSSVSLFVQATDVDAMYKTNPDDILKTIKNKEDGSKAAGGGAAGGSYAFQTEVSRVMKMIINSLYKTKEIFLRELISNASDAIDKIRFLSLTDQSVLGKVKDLNITIVADKKNGILNIRDTGIGMTKEDMIKNLGTIAKSGTSEFLEKMQKEGGTDSNLIGQFGVGFYSAFLVADKVTVISKNNGGPQTIWVSTADSNFSVYADPRGDTLGRGSLISLHLKKDALEYLEEAKLKDLIKRYSEFINFPIYLFSTKTVKEEVPVEEEEAEEKEVVEETDKKETSDDDEFEEDTVEDAAATEKPKKTRTVERVENTFELINDQKPIWARNPKEVSKEEYYGFYKSVSKDTTDPMTYIHFKAEGEIDFRSILYIPAKPDKDILQSGDETIIKSIKLFVKRVFITDEINEIIPRYLAFVKGMVDSDDLPLNVSRETLQQHKLLRLIKKKVIQKIFEMINVLSASVEEYAKFYKEYSTFLKMGVLSDRQNKDRLLKLLRYQTSSSKDGELVSLDDYVGRMKKGQKNIYCLTGSSVAEIEKSPFLEMLVGRGYEVLYMDEPLDEYILQQTMDYKKAMFQNVAKDGLKFGDEEETETKEETEALKERFKPLVEWLQDTLKDFVEKVSVSTRLAKSPGAVVTHSYGYTGNMQKILNSQAYGNKNDPIRNFYMKHKKILEINPYHPLIEALLEASVKTPEDETIRDLSKILYETSMIRSSFELEDTIAFARRVENLLRLTVGVDLKSEAEVQFKKATEAEDDDSDVDENDFEALKKKIERGEKIEHEEDDHAHDEL